MVGKWLSATHHESLVPQVHCCYCPVFGSQMAEGSTSCESGTTSTLLYKCLFFGRQRAKRSASWKSLKVKQVTCIISVAFLSSVCSPHCLPLGPPCCYCYGTIYYCMGLPLCLQVVFLWCNSIMQITNFYLSLQGRARARDAEYVILVDEDLMEDFSDEIRIFKGIESVSVSVFLNELPSEWRYTRSHSTWPKWSQTLKVTQNMTKWSQARSHRTWPKWGQTKSHSTWPKWGHTKLHSIWLKWGQARSPRTWPKWGQAKSPSTWPKRGQTKSPSRWPKWGQAKSSGTWPKWGLNKLYRSWPRWGHAKSHSTLPKWGQTACDQSEAKLGHSTWQSEVKLGHTVLRGQAKPHSTRSKLSYTTTKVWIQWLFTMGSYWSVGCMINTVSTFLDWLVLVIQRSPSLRPAWTGRKLVLHFGVVLGQGSFVHRGNCNGWV